ncbi:uncharacterized protein LOC132249630 [Alligator mississippiensis]|uniref:uncharacterized protein LOC132249630 n=1 Tax=Alligator mississippiensis TaxID=8496 RepID=UPI00287780EF|nr:uncharacterized protein LOC132249630 [Alligator mississippiensis]
MDRYHQGQGKLCSRSVDPRSTPGEQDVTAVITDLIQPSDHYPLTPIHMGTYDAYGDRSTGGFLICSSAARPGRGRPGLWGGRAPRGGGHLGSRPCPRGAATVPAGCEVGPKAGARGSRGLPLPGGSCRSRTQEGLRVQKCLVSSRPETLLFVFRLAELQPLREVFEDVAVYFIQEEWELVEEEDKGLYRDQMLRNYQALVSLGYRGPTPDLICRIQREQVELWVSDDVYCGAILRLEDLLSDKASGGRFNQTAKTSDISH